MNKLYNLRSCQTQAEGIIEAVVALNSSHPLFEGHFPGNPILPGICTVQMAKEILEKTLNRDLTLTKAGNIKYLGFVSPITSPEMQFHFNYKETAGSLHVTITVKSGENQVCSFKAEYGQESAFHIQK